MKRRLDHAEAQDLLGAYALDAIDDDERESIEQHLAECPACRGEVDAHLEAAALMGQGAAQPPDELWQRISGALHRPKPAARPSFSERLSARWSARSRSGLALRVAAGAAAVAAVAAIAVLAVKVADQSSQIDRLTGAPSGDLATAAGDALTSGRGERVVLRSEDGGLAVDAVLLPEGTGYLVRNNLPPLPADRTYQLWAVVGDRVISAGILGPSPGVSAFHVDGSVSGLVVTEERDGGVVSSKNPALTAWLRT